jgi:uncharacterized membrane protein
VLIYMANPNFLYFDAQFSYESLALPLAILVLYALARRVDAQANHRIGLTALLVLVLPGLAVTMALFPWQTLTLAARILFTLGLSVCVTGLVGYALNLTGAGLQRVWWIGALGYLTQVAIILAAYRLRGDERFQARMVSLAPPRDPLPAWLAGRTPSIRLSRGTCLLFALAAVIVVAAFSLNYVNANEETGPGFTQLWMVPAATDVVSLGVTNHEGSAVRYRLVLSLSSGTLASWPNLEIGSGRTWTDSVKLPSWLPFGVELTATLFRDSDPHAAPYRHVTYWIH